MKRTDKPRSIAIQLRALKVSYTGLEHSYVQETLERLAEEVDELWAYYKELVKEFRSVVKK